MTSFQCAFAVASEWFPSPTANANSSFFPYFFISLSSSRSAENFSANPSLSGTNQPSICPPPMLSSKSYNFSYLFLFSKSFSAISLFSSSYNIIICGSSTSAFLRIASRGGILSSIVPSVERTSAEDFFEYSYFSRSTAPTMPMRRARYGVLLTVRTNPEGSSKNSSRAR